MGDVAVTRARRHQARRQAKIRGRAEQVERILALLQLLSDARRPHDVAEVCQGVYGEFTETTRRRFYRDLAALRRARVPVDVNRASHGREKLYRVRTMPSMGRLAPGEDQVFVMAVARNLVGAHLGLQMRQAYDALWERIVRELPQPLADFATYCQSYFLARPPLGQAEEIRPESIRLLARALMENRKVRLRYRKHPESPVDTHTVWPLFVAVVDGVPYLHGFSEERAQRRSFALDRVVALEMTPHTFERPAEFDYAELDAEDVFERSFKAFLGGERDQPVQEVTMIFSRSVARIVRHRRWHPTQRVETLADGRVRLTLRCEVTRDLRAWILSFGRQVRVVRPRQLAREIRAEQRAAAVGR